ncbi:hypothetical protein BU26DRAFT_520526 [Trematosphaeria pertusa]|uniref:Heterokaryon incompatibility domain-containing protein n=1 Tax=Trematosphaeria pertusa TaxID=390896 RepID=A0A6A6I9U7_9PLEO|nr:uncharacterized protein BU26DRAFT_520526 [Trematosphaeria pertusa]KAF2247335.1 hypothetical protein BU26DRAFT_520526 [Trematosphaeria pertusa]
MGDLEAAEKEGCDERRTYTYRPMESATTIRLLELSPGAEENPLRGRLRHIDIDQPGYPAFDPVTMDRDEPDMLHESASDPQCPRYEALSYVWGPVVYSHPLHCDEGKVFITPSLDEALRRLRLSDRVRVLWADGVCINQADVQERGQQVKLMGSIYSKASRVLIWLGADPSNKAPETFQLKFGLNETLTTELLVNFVKSCSWFERMWVVQEAYLGQTALAIWGDAEISFHELESAMAIVRGRIPRERAWMIRMYHTNSAPLDFFQTLSSTRHLKCFDARDRIFALLGLPYKARDQKIVSKIVPDYTVPVHELYYQVACRMIEAGRGADVLRLVLHGSSLAKWPPDLPSWVPNWADSSASCFPSLSHWRMEVRSWASLDQSNLSLIAQGYTLDRVLAASASCWNEEFSGMDTISVTSFWETNIKSMTEKLNRRGDLFFCEAITCGGGFYSLGWADAQQQSAEWFLKFWSAERAAAQTMQVSGLGEEMIVSIRRSITAVKEETKEHENKPIRIPAPERFRHYLRGRKLFITSNQHIGLGPEAMRDGDAIALLDGADTPMVLRQQESFYQVVGAAYISGLIDEEGIQMREQMSDKLETFELR